MLSTVLAALTSFAVILPVALLSRMLEHLIGVVSVGIAYVLAVSLLSLAMFTQLNDILSFEIRTGCLVREWFVWKDVVSLNDVTTARDHRIVVAVMNPTSKQRVVVAGAFLQTEEGRERLHRYASEHLSSANPLFSVWAS